MNKLFIDTSDNTKTIAKLEKNNKIFKEEVMRERASAQETLQLIDKLCIEAQITVRQIEKIYVKRGPGSYTGLRVGVSVANTLSFVLGISVNDKKIGEIELPQYEA